MRRLTTLCAVATVMLLSAVPARAQLSGSHSLGDFGVQSGSQPQPGLYAALFYYRYDTDTIKDADGNTLRLSPDSPASVGITAAAPLLWYVSKTKVLGANYGAFVILPWANGSLEAPAFGLAETIDTSFSDLGIRPLDLGWHAKRADVTAGFQIYVPTGDLRARWQRQHRKGHVDCTSLSSERPSISTRVGASASPRTRFGSSTGRRKTPTSRLARSSRSRGASASRSSVAV